MKNTTRMMSSDMGSVPDSKRYNAAESTVYLHVMCIILAGVRVRLWKRDVRLDGEARAL